LRSLILGTILTVINCYWVISTEIVRTVVIGTVLTVFFNAIFTVFILAALNLLFLKYLPSAALTQSELLVVYIMVSVSTAIYGIDLMEVMVPVMGHAFWFATPENEWKELFFRYLPGWLTVDNKSVLRGYYEGDSSLWMVEHLRAWLVPVLAWTCFICISSFVLVCINSIVRRQWVVNEKLAYPTIQLPVEMTGSSKFFSNRLMWIGFVFAGGLALLDGLNFLLPIIPTPKLRYNIAPLFTNKPFNAISWMPLNFYPLAIGLAYFTPLDLSFSLWFFYLFWQMQLVFRNIMGWEHMPGVFLHGQLSGAWIGLSILSLFSMRRYIRQIFRFVLPASDKTKKAVGKSSVRGDKKEPLRYRTAALGIFGGVAFLTAFWYKAGMTVWIIWAFFLIYFLTVMAATRMRAELGPLAHELHGSGPDRILIETFGSKPFGPKELTLFTLLHWTNYGYRNNPMPNQLEAFKMAEKAEMGYRKLTFAILVATVVGTLTAFLMFLSFFYEYGGSVRVAHSCIFVSQDAFVRLQHLLQNPVSIDFPIMKQRIFGLLFTIFLMFMRRRFLWWPFHPVGYAVSSGWAMSHIWFSVFISWLVKRTLLHYGGLKTYQHSAPLFLGLILGQFVIGSLWSIVGVITNIQVRAFFP